MTSVSTNESARISIYHLINYYYYYYYFFNNFNLQNTVLQYLLTLLTIRVTYAANTILNTVPYRKYNYLQYGLLTLLTI